MNPKFGLLKKDYRISRNMFLTWGAAVILALIGGIALSAYWSQPAGTLPVIILIGLLHFIFAPVFMLGLLNIEAKTQLWLYTPRRGIELIFSKFAVIFTYQLILQMVLTIYTAINLFWFGRQVYDQIGMRLFLEAIILLNILILLFGFYLNSWLTFLWTVYHSMKNVAKLVRWITVIGIVIAYNMVESLLLSATPLRDFLFQYQINVVSDASLSYQDQQWRAVLEPAQIPVIPLLWYLLLFTILVTAAARLLERKVEV
ncbi:hypothetical protein SAMN05192533_11514 [Mesobacillus persicus]|uniref:ABC-2 family transporter protein n=1 Tax=Mesobacillus persicus TaxID=930146 RepID=A0A1H8HH78_9BACI|nr:hypothetical protein [Mesobacillus persicus]SEN55287.1 hypothetical protein SAMN05192533_11514 [Mesobacillus persicus]